MFCALSFFPKTHLLPLLATYIPHPWWRRMYGHLTLISSLGHPFYDLPMPINRCACRFSYEPAYWQSESFPFTPTAGVRFLTSISFFSSHSYDDFIICQIFPLMAGTYTCSLRHKKGPLPETISILPIWTLWKAIARPQLAHPLLIPENGILRLESLAPKLPLWRMRRAVGGGGELAVLAAERNASRHFTTSSPPYIQHLYFLTGLPTHSQWEEEDVGPTPDPMHPAWRSLQSHLSHT